jgi:hypothetical protein
VSVEKLKGAKQRALDCVRNAIKVEAQSISRLRQLYNGTGADPKDDDLKVFNGDRALTIYWGESLAYERAAGSLLARSTSTKPSRQEDAWQTTGAWNADRGS